MDTNSLKALRAWIDVTRDDVVPLGPSKELSRARARELLNEIGPGITSGLVDSIGLDGNAADTLNALCELLADQRPGLRPGEIESAYELVRVIRWPDAFGEREDLLSRLAFLEWECCRKSHRYADAWTWRKRCAQHALAQDHIRAFLTSSFSDRSAELNGRFLSDEATVLVCWSLLDDERNNDARAVSRELSGLISWLETYGLESGLGSELVHFLAASALCSLMLALNHLGNWEGWSELAERARVHASYCEGTEELSALFDHAEAIRLCHRYESSRVEAMARSLVVRFESMSLYDQAAKVRFLLARAVKDQGRGQEAFDLFQEVSVAAAKSNDSALHCLALCQRAQALGLRGSFEEAMRTVAEAVSSSVRSRNPWVKAHVQGTVGELLRDRGDLLGSITAYSAAVECYEELGMVGMGAYLRVILAETFLLAGRPADAVEQVMIALPVVDKEELSREAAVAVRLLREALRRHEADPCALRKLREELRIVPDGDRL